MVIIWWEILKILFNWLSTEWGRCVYWRKKKNDKQIWDQQSYWINSINRESDLSPETQGGDWTSSGLCVWWNIDQNSDCGWRVYMCVGVCVCVCVCVFSMAAYISRNGRAGLLPPGLVTWDFLVRAS